MALTLCRGWLMLLMIPSTLQPTKVWLLLALVVTLIFVGGYASVKTWGEATTNSFDYLCIAYLYVCLFIFFLNTILTSSFLFVHRCWLVSFCAVHAKPCQQLLVTGKPGLTMAFFSLLVPYGIVVGWFSWPVTLVVFGSNRLTRSLLFKRLNPSLDKGPLA